MGAITKASIRKPQSGKRASIFWFISVFLCVATVGNLFINRSSSEEFEKTLKDIGKPKVEQFNQVATSDLASSSKPLGVDNGVVGDTSGSISSTRDQAAVNSGVSPFKNPRGGKEVFIYHHTLRGQQGMEGSVVLDMMMAHAYTFHMGGTYGGSCGAGNDVGRVPENSLIKSIGLQNELRFACPSDQESSDRKKVVPSKDYMTDGVRAFTPEYVTLLKSVAVYPAKTEGNKYTIVVHIARGKNTPCRTQHLGYDTYLPNKHYQTLIDKYMKPNSRVVIYSQKDSFETFDQFREKGYELHIGEPIGDVWNNILLADVVIMSRSSFSYAPAIISKGTVVYTPFWHKPIRGWDVVGKDVLDETEVEFQRLKSTCKASTSKWEKFRKKKSNY